MIKFISGGDHLALAHIPSRFESVDADGAYDISTDGRHGSCYKLTSVDPFYSNPGYVGKRFTTGKTAWVVGCWIKMSALNTTVYNPPLITFAHTDDTDVTYVTHVSLSMNKSGYLYVRRGAPSDAGDVLLDTSTSLLAAGVWYYMVFAVNIDDVAGRWRVWVDGHLWMSGTGDTLNSTTLTTVNRIRIYNPQADSGNYLLVDDIWMADGDPGLPIQVEPVQVEAIFPSSDGDTTDWTCSTGSTNYTLVDDATPTDDTNYVKTATNGTVDLYGFPDSAYLEGKVKAVQLSLYVRGETAVARVIAPVVKIGGVTYVGEEIEVASVTYAYKSVVWEKSPATQADWTIDEINGAEFGVKLVSGALMTRVSQVVLELLIDPRPDDPTPNLGSLRWELRGRVADLDGGNHTDDEYNQAINEAYRYIQVRTKCNIVTEELALTNGTSLYSTGSIFEPLVVIVDGTSLDKIDFSELVSSDNTSLTQTTATHDLAKWYRYSGKSIGINPIPAALAPTATSYIIGYGVSADMTLDSDEPSALPKGFEQKTILDKAEAILRRMRPLYSGNIGLAEQCEVKAEASISEMIKLFGAQS